MTGAREDGFKLSLFGRCSYSHWLCSDPSGNSYSGQESQYCWSYSIFPLPSWCGAQPRSDGPHFVSGETVYVIIDGNFLPSQDAQIKRGLDSWSAANAQNGSGVSFEYNQGPPSEAFDPTIITFTQGSCPGSSITAQSTYTTNRRPELRQRQNAVV
jgi:hypothetical protein